MLHVSVIIAAGGSGRRFVEAGSATGGRATRSKARSGSLTKVFAPLAGRPVLAHTLERFTSIEAVDEVIVAVPADLVKWAAEKFGPTLEGVSARFSRPRRERKRPPSKGGRPLRFVAGGRDRPGSVARALEVTNSKSDLVAVHDAARPLIRPAVIVKAFHEAARHGGAVVGRPLDHTVKSVSDGRFIERTVPRQRLWIAQTPQVFRREALVRAYAERGKAGRDVTDDSQLVEALGLAPVMVRGDAANFKITTPEDLRLCEALLAAGWPFDQ